MALRGGVLAVAALLALGACATPGERLTGVAPPAGRGAAVVVGYIAQTDAVDRSGFLVLRKTDPATRRFLPEGPDTLARVALLPAFRLADIFRTGDLAGSTRLNAEDLTPLVLSPGTWAVERAYTASTSGNLMASGNSLANHDGGALGTLGFEVTADAILALPLLEVWPREQMGRSGPAAITARDGLAEITALAATRGLMVEPGRWSEIEVECAPIRYEGMQLKGEAECAPR